MDPLGIHEPRIVGAVAVTDKGDLGAVGTVSGLSTPPDALASGSALPPETETVLMSLSMSKIRVSLFGDIKKDRGPLEHR